MTKFDLKEAISGCLKNNKNAQRQLYEYFYGYAMNIALRYGRNRDEAVEILNDAFLKVFRGLEQYNAVYPFRTWLRQIVIRSAIDYHRKYHKYPILLDLNEHLDAVSDEIPMPTLAPDEDLLPVLQELSPAYRMVFNLYVIEEYSHQEIAEMLHISVNTSKSNLMRAKLKLRDVLLANQPSSSVKTH